MLYELPAVLPFFIVLTTLAVIGSLASLGVLGQSLARHHRTRVARHETIPSYYRRVVLAH